ncbi:MAG: hypothetical protein KatS3mg115_1922 [Candidatus Poribacteria bacterium]|nr:MAG: hypothetical protein KatS3mg115_1922 [Candidatus Poribacteria bacterium]
MVARSYRVLTEEQIEHFLEKGYVHLEQVFPRELAEEWRALAFKRLGYDPDDPSTWVEARVHLPTLHRVRVKDVAPQAWGAICDLLGGEERIANAEHYSWGDGFIINFRLGADREWVPPGPEVRGWHKDGDFFRHFLDSPEQGLLTIVIWSDIAPRSGGTFVATDSVPIVARFLAEHPEGVLPGQFPFQEMIRECREFVELTGRAGDVVLLHPYILHSASYNPSGRARFITNPPVALREPMNFNRPDPSEYSPVELAVLRGLGVKRYAFRPTAPRERIVPERVRRQQQMLEEQKASPGDRLGPLSAANVHVERIEGSPGGHKEPVFLSSAKAEVGTRLR